MTKSVRRLATAAFPSSLRLWDTYKRWRLRTMLSQFVAAFGPVVQNGPFRELKYLSRSAGSALLPKLIGSYEAALHPAIAEFMQRNYDNVIVVGCAEGYYAVGLARHWPGLPVIAFDTDPMARRMCAELASLNGVADQITIRGECTPAALELAIGNRSLIVCDCEGNEETLLDPNLVKGLNRADLIVELHPFVDAAIPGVVARRFRGSHQSTLVHAAAKAVRYKELAIFRWFDRKLATYEERGGHEELWVVLTS